MSNSDILLVKNEEEEEELRNFEIVKRPTLKFQTASIESLSESSKSHDSEDKKEENNDYHKIEECKQADLESRTLSPEEKRKEKDEEDGFRTPTSLDHRISVAMKCPPAPRKNKPSLKRRTPYNHCRYPLDLSKEVELLFPSKKKVRREEPK